MVLTEDGNVGIGTGEPSVGEQPLKLDVEGAVGASHYCDQNGNNCTVASNLGGGGGPVEIIAVHSQTTSIPACLLGWDTLWNGYSLAGSFIGAGYEAFNDLGSSGSCVEVFRPIPVIECSNPTNCDFYTGSDVGMWLSTDTVDKPNISVVANILPQISRCVVREKA